MFSIGRLVRIKQFVASEVINEARFNNPFYYLRDWAIVRELIFVEGIFGGGSNKLLVTLLLGAFSTTLQTCVR